MLICTVNIAKLVIHASLLRIQFYNIEIYLQIIENIDITEDNKKEILTNMIDASENSANMTVEDLTSTSNAISMVVMKLDDPSDQVTLI